MISRAGHRKLFKAYVALKLHHFPMLVLHELLQFFNCPALHKTQPRRRLLDAIAIDHNACSEMWGHDGDQAREGAHDGVPGITRQERRGPLYAAYITYLAPRLSSAVSGWIINIVVSLVMRERLAPVRETHAHAIPFTDITLTC